MTRKRNLTQRLLAPTLGIIAASGISCEYPYESYPVQQNTPRQHTSQRQRPPVRDTSPTPQPKKTYTLHDSSSKVLLKQNDPRFHTLKPHYFFACRYKGDGKIDFKDERNIFYGGEKFIVMVAIPRNLWGSKLNFIAGTPNDKIIMNGNQIANDNSNHFFDVNSLLNTGGQGKYKFAWGFDGKLACIHYIQLRERR